MRTLVSALVLSTLVACSSTPAPRAPTDGATASQSGATAPDPAKAAEHVKKHVQYPATREAILAACADTPEFSADEKAWFAKTLPPGNYKNADEVIKALKL